MEFAMSKLMRVGVPVVMLVLVLAYVYQQQSEVELPKGYTDLERVGDECDLIAAKAAMNLPEALPFQKLEKAARQSKVLQTCMNDRGYIENPAWVKFAEPITQQQAKDKKISVNEAYETLRREKLKTFASIKGEPPYWILAQPAQNTTP
jgi:hypothetical protein